jgi:hypothetical protein
MRSHDPYGWSCEYGSTPRIFSCHVWATSKRKAEPDGTRTLHRQINAISSCAIFLPAIVTKKKTQALTLRVDKSTESEQKHRARDLIAWLLHARHSPCSSKKFARTTNRGSCSHGKCLPKIRPQRVQNKVKRQSGAWRTGRNLGRTFSNVCVEYASANRFRANSATSKRGIQRSAPIGPREGCKAKPDLVVSGWQFYAAEQYVRSQNRRRLSVDLGDPAGMIDIMQRQQPTVSRVRGDLHTARP